MKRFWSIDSFPTCSEHLPDTASEVLGMLLPSRAVALVIVFVVTLGAVVSFYLGGKWKPKSLDLILPTQHYSHESCPKSVDWLSNLTITFPIKYARRDIIVNPNPETQRAYLTKIKTPLFPSSQLIDLTGGPEVDFKHCMEPLVLDVPVTPEEPVDASHVVFGMSTLLDRLELSIVDLQRWLAHTNAQLIIIAMGPDETDPDPHQMAEMQSRMRALGLKVTIVKRLAKDDFMPERYFSLIKIMYEKREPSVKWMAVIDDDTFFPSLHSLTETLDRFDPDQRWYIGAMSEEWWAVVRYGLMAFGGAGVFLSMPLAAVLDSHYDDCKRRSGAGAGDMRILECIVWHTDTKLTHVSGLHQMDIHGDMSGIYESGRLPLSLHHWKQGWWDEEGYGTWFPMAAMHRVADICGDCFLQRWQFDDDMILSNGYSIAEYPTGAWTKLDKEAQLDKPENTWLAAGIVEGSNNAGWDHYVGPLRPKLTLEEEKIQYRFLDAVAVDGGVRQFYIHLGLDRDFDTLLELFWSRKKEVDTSLEPKSLG